MDHMANCGECTSSHNTHVSWHPEETFGDY